MTNLEYMICEAESNGDIDLDTRNQLLNALYESTNNSPNGELKMIDKYSKRNYYRKIISKAISIMKHDVTHLNNADKYITEEIKRFKYLIDECKSYKRTALKKIPISDTIKKAGYTGVEGALAGAGTGVILNTIGIKSDIKKSAITSAALSSATNIASDIRFNHIIRDAKSLDSSIEKLTENMNKLKSEYPKYKKEFKNSTVYQKKLKKINKNKAIKECVDDLYNDLH